MFGAQTQFAFSVFVLLFMHQFVMFELTPETTDIIITSSNNRAVSILPESKLWKDAVIAYEIDSSLEPHRCLIESAMMHIMLQSCVLFRPMQNQNRNEQALFIVKDDSRRCAATLGAPDPGWLSKLSLSAEHCFKIGIILHELMHVLGFKHELQRADRDQYLQINYDNIKNPKHFKKNNRSKETYFPEFDFDSITMYGHWSSSKDRKRLKTIESKVAGNGVVSSKYKLNLSPLDIKSTNELYKCHLVDNKACEKVVLLNSYIVNCSVEARKYINLSWIKKLIHQCE